MNRRIVIVGFMGSGKTTVARVLAARLSCEMIDLDSFIAERDGRSPAETIQEDGEPAFREIETQALRDALAQSKAHLIALGGGAWAIETNRALINSNDCLTVWLDAPFEICWERIQADGNIRPLAPDREAALSLYQSRQDYYRLASIHVRVDRSETSESLADKILTQT